MKKAPKEAKVILNQFQCDYNRSLEESFAQTFSENDKVRLFFINENEAFTDGMNIVVDPAIDNLYCDKETVRKTADFMNFHLKFFDDMWNILRVITRRQTIHECLHILYSNFPPQVNFDKRLTRKIDIKITGIISNIIEDEYIESAGCSVYDNIEFYLRFGRLAKFFLNENHDSETGYENTGDFITRRSKLDKKIGTLLEYLNYMLIFLFYPMMEHKKPPLRIAKYVKKTKQLFLDGSAAASPEKRYEYSYKIYEIIKPLIPDIDDKDVKDFERRPEFKKFCKFIGNTKTHNSEPNTINEIKRKGRTQEISARLFTDKDGKERAAEYNESHITMLFLEFLKERVNALSIPLYSGTQYTYAAEDFDCSELHQGISITEFYPKPNLNHKSAYRNICNKYRLSINSYSNKFSQILKERVSERNEKCLFGAGIVSKRLADPQKRYWYRDEEKTDTPDIAILLLIDGSSSMKGEKRDNALKAAIILHEVLAKQGIKHSIVEHRAIYDEPEVDANVLVRFNGVKEEKYNLMRIKAENNTREGLALFWAERYINKDVAADKKIIITISDGLPEHQYDDYIPPLSMIDTKYAAEKIIKRGTKIIAVSLDEAGNYDCYEALKIIYPNIIACNDLSRLTGQLVNLIAKLI